MDFSNVKQLIIPEGEVKQIAIGGAIVWKKPLYDAQIEYLESDGTQWISTPVKISSFGRLEVDASFTTWAGAVDTLWCARKIITSNNIQNSFALFKLANGTLGWDVRPNGSTNRITVNFAGDTNKHNYRQAGNALYIDGTQVATTTATISESGGPLYLFVSNFVNDEMTNPASGRLYKAEYFDENGNLVMQLVPVRKDGVGYLFDRVSQTLFGNQGSGNFALGPDIVPIEYIESTGTQWINTELGYFPDFEIGCKMRESVGNVTIGVNQAWAFSRNSATDPTWKLLANSRTLKTSVPVTSYVDASYKNGSFVANSTVIASEPNQFVSGDMLVFTRGSNLPASYPAVLYYLKCYDWNGNLVRDFIPVRAGTAGYLLDKVSGRLFGNKGTGDFVCGGDL